MRNVLDLPAADRSDAVRRALERACAARRVGRVEFPSAALAFRAVQAKRAGLAFDGVDFVIRDGGRREVSSLADVEEAWCGVYNLTPPPPPLSETERGGAAGLCPAIKAPGVFSLRRSLSGPPLSVSERGAGGGEVTPLTVCVPHYNLGRFLPETLASIAAQDHPALDVVVIDDGSTDAHSLRVFAEMEQQYPAWRFLRQPNAGIGATRNRGLAEARGAYFLPVDADNILRPDMASVMARAMTLRPDAAALSCYFLAFRESPDIAAGRFEYACRPTGGPFALAVRKNVYGDACALYRTDTLRAAGGWEEDRGTSFEDWELFVKLAGRGHVIDVVPEHLFYYRHLPTGFSRTTDQAANRRRVMRQFRHADGLPAHERELVFAALAGLAMADERRRGGGWRARMARWLTGGA